MNSVSGIPKDRDRNSGIYTMVQSRKVKMYVYFRSATGRNSIYGIIYDVKKIDLPTIYFSHERDVISHEGQLVAVSSFIRLEESDQVMRKTVRYRTVGDMTCTAAVESSASNIDDIINEIILTRTSERGETRIDDKISEAAMEDRKKNGYF